MMQYWRVSRSASHNFVLAALLLVLYEASQVLVTGPVRLTNAVDALFEQVLALLPNGTLLLSAAILLGGVIYILADTRKGIRLQPTALLYMLGESLGWAVLILFNIRFIVAQLPIAQSIDQVAAQLGGGVQPSLYQLYSLSLGAGFYEELFFRLLVVWGLLAITRLLGQNPKSFLTYAIVVLLSALLFSLAHTEMLLGNEPFNLYVFTFRTVFGLIMSALLLIRGFAITAWAHAWYDILVFTLQAN